LHVGEHKNRFMRIKPFFVATAVFTLVGGLLAGTLELQPKESVPPTITQAEPWQFTIAVPGWLSSFNGNIGVRRVNADIDVGVDQVLQHLDMIFAIRAEAQKGPFGIYGEFLYVGMSDDTQINGLINNVHEQVDPYMFDGGLSWRLFNQPRWSLDFAAGTHYSSVYERLELHSDPIAIDQASEQFVDNIADHLRDRLNQDISNSQFIARLKSTIEADIVSRIDNRNSLERHQRRPNIPIGPLGGRIKEEVAQVVQHFIQTKEAALRVRIDALHLRGAARRAAVTRAVNAAETQIANQLSSILDTKLGQTIARDDYWFDPYVGLRGRYNFNKTVYTSVRGEIGGFGVGADLMWQVEGVIGINLTRSVFTEIGYRALGADFRDNNFVFDVVLHGPQITTGITF